MKDNKTSNRVIGVVVTVVAVVLLVVIYFLPVSINIPCEESGYTVLMQEIEYDLSEGNQGSDIHMKSYFFESDSKEALELQDIIEKYSYHRTFATIFTPKEKVHLSGTDCGYYITINCGEEWLMSGGTGEIMLNGKLYDVGYFGNEKALEMQKEIKAFLDKGEDYEITD